MECKKYWEILEVSTLDRMKIEKTRKKLDDHINSCQLCKEKFSKVEEYDKKTKAEMADIDVPEELKSKIKLNLVGVNIKASKNHKSLIIAGSLILVILLVLWIII